MESRVAPFSGVEKPKMLVKFMDEDTDRDDQQENTDEHFSASVEIKHGNGEDVVNSSRDVVNSSSLSSIAKRRRRLRLRPTDAVDPEISEVVTFCGRNELRRASRLTTVMGSGARILGNSKGSADTYSLSEEVAAIDLFLSHNWVVSRKKKFLSLVLHFNLGLAILAVVAMIAVIVAATTWGIRPFTVQVASARPSGGLVEFTPACTVSVTPVFLLVLCFGHELKRLVGCRDRSVFLDKTCIYQVDKEVQREGIRKLGAFLRSSSSMVVIYTDVYLARLWTVYEVACFLSLHPASHLVVLPAHQPQVVFGGTALWYGTIVLAVVSWSLGGPFYIVIAIMSFLGYFGMSVLVRRWARAKEGIHQRIAHFQVDKCMCACEEDRPLVYQNIARLMRATGEAGIAASDEQALEAFNWVVRNRLSRSLIASLGPLGLGYLHVIAPALCAGLTLGIDRILLGVPPCSEELIVRHRICFLSIYVATAFGTYPMSFVLLSKWGGLCLHINGCRECVFVGVGAFLVWAAFFLFIASADQLAWMAVSPGPHRDLSAVGLAVLIGVPIVLAIIIFDRARRLREMGEEEPEEEEEEEEERETEEKDDDGVQDEEEEEEKKEDEQEKKSMEKKSMEKAEAVAEGRRRRGWKMQVPTTSKGDGKGDAVDLAPGSAIWIDNEAKRRGVRLEGFDGLANNLNEIKKACEQDPESIWLIFDWDKTLKLPFLKDIGDDLPADAPKWRRNLAKDLRGGSATMLALEQSPFQKFIITAKSPQELGNPATALVIEHGKTLHDPLFLRMHKCFGMATHDGTAIKYTTDLASPETSTIEYTEGETLESASWGKVPKNSLAPPNSVYCARSDDSTGKEVEDVYKFAQNSQREGGAWHFHFDIEATPFEPSDKTGLSFPANGGMLYFPYDKHHDGTLLKRVGNVYASGYHKYMAVAKAVQFAHQKKQVLPKKIYFYDDNVDNAYEVHTMAQKYIKQVLPEVHIEVEGIFWDPFEEEMSGVIGVTSSQGGKDFALDKVINQQNFREDPKTAVEKAAGSVKLEHLQFYGLDVDDLVARFRKYLPIWDEDAAQKGIKLGELQGEAAKTSEQLEAEEMARRDSILRKAKAEAKKLGLEEVEAEEVDKEGASNVLERGPVKTGIAKIPDFGLEKARSTRLKMREEIERYLSGDLSYDMLSEACRNDFEEADGQAAAQTKLKVIAQDVQEIDKRLEEVQEKKKAKLAAKAKGKAAPAPKQAVKGKGGEKGKGKGK